MVLHGSAHGRQHDETRGSGAADATDGEATTSPAAARAPQTARAARMTVTRGGAAAPTPARAGPA